MKTKEPDPEEWVVFPAYLKEWRAFIPERTGLRLIIVNLN